MSETKLTYTKYYCNYHSYRSDRHHLLGLLGMVTINVSQPFIFSSPPKLEGLGSNLPSSTFTRPSIQPVRSWLASDAKKWRNEQETEETIKHGKHPKPWNFPPGFCCIHWAKLGSVGSVAQAIGSWIGCKLRQQCATLPLWATKEYKRSKFAEIPQVSCCGNLPRWHSFYHACPSVLYILIAPEMTGELIRQVFAWLNESWRVIQLCETH